MMVAKSITSSPAPGLGGSIIGPGVVVAHPAANMTTKLIIINEWRIMPHSFAQAATPFRRLRRLDRASPAAAPIFRTPWRQYQTQGTSFSQVLIGQ
jgi:hypothetical protein